MTVTWYLTKRGLFQEWDCCGLLWQLYPRRWRVEETWHPTCPRCGSTLPQKNPRTRRSATRQRPQRP